MTPRKIVSIKREKRKGKWGIYTAWMGNGFLLVCSNIIIM